jgi:hypothetical protein
MSRAEIPVCDPAAHQALPGAPNLAGHRLMATRPKLRGLAAVNWRGELGEGDRDELVL